MRFSSLLSGIILSAAMATSMAAEYRLVATFVPGSQSDAAARHIQNSFERITGDKIIIENAPGAETVIGTMRYKTTNADIVTVSAAQIIFNPVLKKDLPYSDEDFDFVLYAGTAPGIWVTRPNTNIKLKDLATNMPKLVGGYVASYNANLTAFIKERGVKSEIVPYKGSPEIVVDIINGSIDIGILAVNSTVMELVKAGKISIIGSTYSEDITLDGVAIPSVSKHLGVTQFNGFVSYAFRPGMDADKHASLKKGLWEAISDPATQEKLRKLYILPDHSQDHKQIQRYFQNYRNKVKSYIGN